MQHELSLLPISQYLQSAEGASESTKAPLAVRGRFQVIMPSRFAAITVGPYGRPKLSRDGRTVVVSIPISLRRLSDRKQVVTPADGAPWSPPAARVDSTLVKALVRAHRWRGLLESNLLHRYVITPRQRRSMNPTFAACFGSPCSPRRSPKPS